MTSISDKSLQRERRRRRPPRRRTELPLGLYAGFLLAVWVAVFLVARTGAVWAPWLLLAAVLAIVAWTLWELWAGRRER